MAIKVCALDLPYLEVMIPHMIRQARFDFAERILVVDPRMRFGGKYGSRANGVSGEPTALLRVLSRMRQQGVVDRIVEALPYASEVRSVYRRYFVGEPPEDSHAHSGSPLYAGLLGLESARTDLVVLMDADILFHCSGQSWVAEGVEKLQSESKFWLAMTQAGPPGGALATPESLGPSNQKHADWDAKHRVWRFTHASSRYFLTDRRRLRKNLPVVYSQYGLEPLEVSLSHALRRAGTYRINLALEGSWDLHVFSHAEPFPTWAKQLVALVERGVFPKEQRGEYDLDLQDPRWRQCWEPLVCGSRLESSPG